MTSASARLTNESPNPLLCKNEDEVSAAGLAPIARLFEKLYEEFGPTASFVN
ncbi:MAG: hypothetical protein Q7R48_04030 [bacterium]|nr:hypothetical protein [bacterium]